MAGSEVQFGLEWRKYPTELGSNVPLGCDRELCSRRLTNDAPRLFSTALDEIEFLRLANKGKGTLYSQFLHHSLSLLTPCKIWSGFLLETSRHCTSYGL